MANNNQVSIAWASDRKASSGNMSTDGHTIYSYKLVIGITLHDGTKVALDYTAKGKASVSSTTSKHVGKVSGNADQTVDPRTAVANDWITDSTLHNSLR